MEDSGKEDAEEIDSMASVGDKGDDGKVTGLN